MTRNFSKIFYSIIFFEYKFYAAKLFKDFLLQLNSLNRKIMMRNFLKFFYTIEYISIRFNRKFMPRNFLKFFYIIWIDFCDWLMIMLCFGCWLFFYMGFYCLFLCLEYFRRFLFFGFGWCLWLLFVLCFFLLCVGVFF